MERTPAQDDYQVPILPGSNINNNNNNNNNNSIGNDLSSESPPITTLPSSTPNPSSDHPSSNTAQETITPLNRTTTTQSTNSNAVSSNSDPPRTFSPPYFRGDPATVFRFPQGGDITPSIRSERIQGLSSSIRPSSSSIRNGISSSVGHHHPFQLSHQLHHRNIDSRHSHQDTSRPLLIDYAGLDASVAEAQLIENGFERPFFESGASKEGGTRPGGFERATSTGSSGFGHTPEEGHFRRRSARKASFYSERAPRPPLPESLRYTFYSQTTGMIQAGSLPRILSNASLQGDPGSEGPAVFSDLLKDGCYWLDILDPDDFDMQILAKHFHIHPLTIEDISTEEVREKYEVFRHYYFVCFRTFDQDYNSGSYLQPASMYSVVLRDGIITFHFRPSNHHVNVLRRIEQLQSHITLTPDWINYALLDDIADSFASPIQTIEYEVDSIDELVLLLRENETSDMLRRIGSCRKNVMAMSRLLANKADVVRGLMKRFDERYAVAPLASVASVPVPAYAPGAASNHQGNHGQQAEVDQLQDQSVPVAQTPASAPTGAQSPAPVPVGASTCNQPQHAHLQPHYHQQYRDGEILLYLGDILDHVLTMLQSLYGYEKVLDRSHSNYLAQISLEINQLSNKTNEVVGTLTFFASLIVPMTFVSGLWGMNVHVPGQPDMDGEPLYWWWGLIGFMVFYCIVAVAFGKHYGLI
ncbi:CorA metal ion transporter [Podila epigama]|nr:CorA metal ion transporter [Podila epigama]